MFEKIQVLKSERGKARAIGKLLEPFAYDKLKKGDASLQKNVQKMNAYLNSK